MGQPPYAGDKPHLAYPQEQYRAMLAVPDEVLTASASYVEPPVPAPA